MEEVDKPAHYVAESGMEAIEVIEAFDLNFNLGNVVKYVLRAGKKGCKTTDLEKAKWYLEREMAKGCKEKVKEDIDEILKHIFGSR